MNRTGTRIYTGVICFIILCPVVIFIFATVISATDESIENLLPLPSFSEGWVIEEKVKSYTRDTLYIYIDGESELYFPYGFEVVGSALYVNVSNPDVALIADVYRMGSLLDAFGIYSNYRRPDAEVIKIGSEGFVTSSQLMFYKDRYFVQLNASGTSNMERGVFFACAEAIAKRIADKSSYPKELELLKISNVIPRTEKYIAQSVLGYAFFRKGLVASAAFEGEPVRVFIILEESMRDSASTLDQYINYLKKEGIRTEMHRDKGEVILIAQDPLYKGVIVRQSGRYLIGVTGLKDLTKGIVLVDRLKSRITPP